MDEETVDRLWDDLHGRTGDSLRAVTLFDRLDHHSRLREDLRGRYSEETANALVDQNIVDRFSEERILNSANLDALDAVVRFYPTNLVVAWSPPDDLKRGVLVSMDREDGTGSMQDLDGVIDYLTSPGFDPFE